MVARETVQVDPTPWRRAVNRVRWGSSSRRVRCQVVRDQVRDFFSESRRLVTSCVTMCRSHRNGLALRLAVSLWTWFALATVASGQSLEDWLKYLDSDRFREREEATRALIEAGEAAIGPLSDAAKTGSQERRARAIFVLKRIALQEDPLVRGPARGALEELERVGSQVVKHRVREAMVELDEIRQSRVLAYLRDRGATVRNDLILLEQRIAATGGFALVFDAQWKGTPEDLSRLALLQDLAAVQMSGDWIDDLVLREVAGARQLRLLSIRNATISVSGVEALVTMEKLSGLEFRYCPIGDEVIAALKRSSFLERLKLIGTKVSRAGADDLIDLFGASVVDFRQGGFLGVSCATQDQQCYVIQLVVESAAQKADIRVNDVIEQVEEIAITSSDQLIEVLSKYAVGDEVSVTWSRGGERFTKKLVLGEFADLR